MSLRPCVMIMGLFILLNAATGMAVAQQSSGNSGALTVSREDIISHLDLKIFEAAAGDLSACEGDEHCLKHAKRIKTFLCVADTCDGTDKNKAPTSCFGDLFDKLSPEVQGAAATICSFIKSPNAETRKDVIAHVPNSKESYLIVDGAYILALKGSDQACEESIKSYVGPYGPQWDYSWYRALSGCRILAHQSTRDQEEKDFYTWLGVVRGLGNCSDISNNEMRKACSAPGAASPDNCVESGCHYGE